MRGDRASSFARSRPRARPLVRSRAFAVESITGRRVRSRVVECGDRGPSRPVMRCPRGIVEYLAVCVNSDGGGSRIDPAARGERGMVLDGMYAKRVCIIRILTQRYLSRVKLIIYL